MLRKLSITAAFLLLASTSAFAAGTAGLATGATMSASDGGKTLYADKVTAATTTAVVGKSSTGAALAVSSTSLGYALTTQHVNGSKAFASSHDSTNIYSIDITATKGVFKLAPSNIGTADFSTWGTM